VIRRLIASGLCVVFQAGAFSAPFVHAHLDDHETDHHRAGTIHAHFAPHHSSSAPSSGSGATLHAERHDRALFLQAFVAVATPPVDSPAPPAVVFALLVPAESPAHPWAITVSGRSPPVETSLAPRAPPALLSVM
jgi:hypothetical protein